MPQYFRFHFYDGKGPVQVFADSRQAAEDFVRARYGASFTFASEGPPLPGGYINENIVVTGGAPPPDYSGSHNPGGQYTYPGTEGNSVTNQNAIQETDPYGAFANFFNIPALGGSPFKKWQARQAGATVGAYNLMGKHNPTLSLRDYLAQTGIMGARSDIGDEFSNLIGSGNEDEFTLQKEAAGGDWDDVMRTALMGKRGRAYGGALANNLEGLQRTYEASPEGFEQGGDYGFLRNYLRPRFGI